MLSVRLQKVTLWPTSSLSSVDDTYVYVKTDFWHTSPNWLGSRNTKGWCECTFFCVVFLQGFCMQSTNTRPASMHKQSGLDGTNCLLWRQMEPLVSPNFLSLCSPLECGPPFSIPKVTVWNLYWVANSTLIGRHIWIGGRVITTTTDYCRASVDLLLEVYAKTLRKFFTVPDSEFHAVWDVHSYINKFATDT